VDIDENDAWRFQPCAPAVASVRGNPEIKTPLQYVRTDPDVIPKVTLTGDTTQRTDGRVLQVIYSFDPASLPLYVGQLMDVLIEAAPIGETTSGPRHPAGPCGDLASGNRKSQPVNGRKH
jgi:HlyD family secretion protein